MRCRHKHWLPAQMTFNKPLNAPSRVGCMSDEAMLPIVFGITTVTQTCAECGFARSYTTPGDAR